MKRSKQCLWSIGFWAALIAFTTYISLDTFVLSKSYDTNATEMNTAMFSAISPEEKDDTDEAPAVSDAAQEPGLTADARQEDSAPADAGQAAADNRSTTNRWSTQQFGSNGGRTTWSGNSWWSSEGDTASGIDASAAYTGDTTYQDENITITLTEYERNDTKIYVADVTLSSAQYLKTAFANDTYGKNVTATTSAIAQSNDAILAINGDYYGAQESGYVIRNGIVYRGTAKGTDVLCIFADGTMEVVNDRDYTAEALVEKGVWQAFSFGPALLLDGAVSVSVREGVGREMASNPRTAIGLIDANHFLFVVSDGRTDESEGLSLYELAQFMQELGVQTAYNLDGGGSSTMYFNGQVVNNPTSTGRIQERGVSDIVYIGQSS